MDEKNVTQSTPLNPSGIPQELRDQPQWVCWRPGPPRKNGKIPKFPINPHNDGFALTNIPKTWGSFAEALQHCRKVITSAMGSALSLTR